MQVFWRVAFLQRYQVYANDPDAFQVPSVTLAVDLSNDSEIAGVESTACGVTTDTESGALVAGK